MMMLVLMTDECGVKHFKFGGFRHAFDPVRDYLCR